MLATQFLTKKIKYDGSQLRSLFAYLDHGVLGDSVVAFRGGCNITVEHMVDGEDLLAKEKICGDDMLHFIFEVFDQNLLSGVLLQRLFASIVGDTLVKMAKSPVKVVRHGDDLYVGKGKLSISIATRSINSVMIHFAVNISNKGTPVQTVALEDFGIAPAKFAEACLKAVRSEFDSIIVATKKVRSV